MTTVIASFVSFAFAAVLAAVPPELEKIVATVVEGFRNQDRLAVKSRMPLWHSLGGAGDRLLIYADIVIDSWRIVSTEPAENGLYLNVEMDGTATVKNTGERRRWPRQWSIQVVQIDGKWLLDQALMRERRLAEQHWKSPATLRRLLDEEPELVFGDFMNFVAYLASSPNIEHSRPTFEWILEEAGKRNKPVEQALAYRMLSLLALKAPFDPAESLAMAQRSLPYAVASGDPDAIAESYGYIGDAYSAAGRIDEAVAAKRRASTYHDRAFDARVATSALSDAIELEVARNDLRAALADAELYQTMTRRHASPNDRMFGKFRIGEIHERLGNFEIARQYYEEASSIAHEQGYPEWKLRTAQKIARHEKELGHTDSARAILEKLRRQFRPGKEPKKLLVMTLTALAEMQLDAGDTGATEEILNEALSVIAANPEVPAENVAEVYVWRSRLRLMQGMPEEALNDARLARAKAGRPRADALTAEGRALRMLSRNADAEEVLRAAIDLVEVELSKLSVDATGSGKVLNPRLGSYRELLELLVDQGCAREALTVAERMRARSLRETLEYGHVDLSAGLDAAKREQERALEQALADVNRKLLEAGATAETARLQQERTEARLALRRFRSELYATHRNLDRRRPEVVSHGELLQPSIAAGELVLEFAVLDRAVFVFALRDDDVTVHRIALSREALERKVGAFVSAIEQRDLGYTEHARALYDLLLEPVAQQLGTAASLRVVPDGATWRLPFHALVDRRGKHLIERMPVAYSPSLALARTAAARTGMQRTLLAFGDPAIRTETAQATRSLFRDVSLGRLPDAAVEARSIARLYKDANVRIGADAREAAFKDDAPAYRVLHLAAHSIIDDRAPMFSSIVLSASGTNPLEDGLLEAREIAGLDLRADLAVLSACETARGAVTAGEGVVGLSWAFLAAGVPTTVVSQWKVSSASTAELMIGFHRQLRGGRKATDALRAAMLDLRRAPRWRHPFYWAPFAIIENSGIPSKR